MKSRDVRGEQYRARRRRLEDAIDALSTEAKSKLLKPSFARMNPAARIKYNVFYFGIAEQAPRAVVRGPWLYIDAPTAKLPNGVESYSENEGRRTHAGRFRQVDESGIIALKGCFLQQSGRYPESVSGSWA